MMNLKVFLLFIKPAQGIKSLYLDFTSPWRRDLMIPLLDNNPLPIRENLLKYLKEDLERTGESIKRDNWKAFKTLIVKLSSFNG